MRSLSKVIVTRSLTIKGDSVKSVQRLIDQARDKVGTDAELARQLGIPSGNLAHMRSGVRTVSPEMVGLLCNLLELPGEEAREWLAIAVLENPKNSSRVEVFRKAFFACLVSTVVPLGISPDYAKSQPMDDAQKTVMAEVDKREIVKLPNSLSIHWRRLVAGLGRLLLRVRLPLPPVAITPPTF